MRKAATSPGIAGNDLNRCEVQALQRKELERTAKERLYSLQTVGKGWCEWEMEGKKELLWIAIRKDLCKRKTFGLRKRAVFSAHARLSDKVKLFSAHNKTDYALHQS